MENSQSTWPVEVLIECSIFQILVSPLFHFGNTAGDSNYITIHFYFVKYGKMPKRRESSHRPTPDPTLRSGTPIAGGR